MCDFVGTPLNSLEPAPFVSYVNSVTGWNMSLYEVLKVGERANTLARLFNCREGFTPDDDVLPQRLHEGIGNGPLKGQRIDPAEFLAARRVYYEMAGWNPETGRPTSAKLAELGIDAAAIRGAGGRGRLNLVPARAGAGTLVVPSRQQLPAGIPRFPRGRQ